MEYLLIRSVMYNIHTVLTDERSQPITGVRQEATLGGGQVAARHTHILTETHSADAEAKRGFL